jgi:hypothetical protein
MDATQRIEARAAFAAAEGAVNVVLTQMTQQFRPGFTEADVAAWKPAYRLALIGEGSTPRFVADDILRGYTHLLIEWKKRDAPKPADLADAIGRMQGERRGAKPLAIAAPTQQPCRYCGGHGWLNFYAKDSAGWQKHRADCQHTKAWRESMRESGWRSLFDLSPKERLEVYPSKPSPRGSVGDTASAILGTELDASERAARERLKDTLSRMADADAPAGA